MLMQSKQQSPSLFVRLEDRQFFTALCSPLPVNQGLQRLEVFGPSCSGRKTLLRGLLQQRSQLGGFHYLIRGEGASDQLDRALGHEDVKTIVLWDLPPNLVRQCVDEIAFREFSEPCLIAWDHDESMEKRTAADYYLGTSVRVYHDEDERALQQAMAHHFLGTYPEAEAFLNVELASSNLLWYPRSYHAYRMALSLLEHSGKKIDFWKVLLFVDRPNE
jgi:hypothetical protein